MIKIDTIKPYILLFLFVILVFDLKQNITNLDTVINYNMGKYTLDNTPKGYNFNFDVKISEEVQNIVTPQEPLNPNGYITGAQMFIYTRILIVCMLESALIIYILSLLSNTVPRLRKLGEYLKDE